MAESIVAMEAPTSSPTPDPLFTFPGIDDDRPMFGADHHGVVEGTTHRDHLSSNQELVLVIFLLTSATLSLLGSITIMTKVIRKSTQTSTYDRLMMCLSCSNILVSVISAASPFLIPRGMSTHILAVGNDMTCSALGFFQQLSFTSTMYSAMLSYYYLVKVRFSLNAFQICAWEWWMHLVAIGIPLFTAGLGAALGRYGIMDVGVGCWTNHKLHSHIWGCVFGLIPIGFTVVSLSMNHQTIYRHIRRSSSSNSSVREMQDGGGIRPHCVNEYFDGRDQDSSQRQDRVVSGDDMDKESIQQVATQGFCYMGIYFLSYASTISLLILEAVSDPHNQDVYWLLVIQSICLPLQGFLNTIVYHWPNYVMVRAEYPDLSGTTVFCRVICRPALPEMVENNSSLLPAGPDRHLSGGHHIMEESPRPISFFPPQPSDEYFRACVRSVLSQPTRSPNHSTVPETVPETDEECDGDDNTLEEMN